MFQWLRQRNRQHNMIRNLNAAVSLLTATSHNINCVFNNLLAGGNELWKSWQTVRTFTTHNEVKWWLWTETALKCSFYSSFLHAPQGMLSTKGGHLLGWLLHLVWYARMVRGRVPEALQLCYRQKGGKACHKQSALLASQRPLSSSF